MRGYLAWLADQADAGTLDGDPLTDPIAATGAVRDFRRHLKTGRRAPNTIDTYLSAIDDFYTRRGLGQIRMLPVHADLRQALTDWLTTRADRKGADTHAALFLNHRGARLSDRAARDIITGFGAAVGLHDDPAELFSPHVLRHTFATQLIRDGKDPILVAELLGHGSLDTTRRYVLPAEADKAAALDTVVTDQWTARSATLALALHLTRPPHDSSSPILPGHDDTATTLPSAVTGAAIPIKLFSAPMAVPGFRDPCACRKLRQRR
ncbi:tyrosine-type recombinase/integrase [Nonomuraea angiospora]|uniref:Tyr recombinase domain-containing protein n=1 Tax=Nonomuraea angiospora TaxID=46172 RepID=A0ABR9M5X5_9ACTN|nr:tyrosine-type recombinase/integrase [Nonomuraea angiospora]MBE1588318.1 hypothetical protein [Nonomuraea angiospora]